jgi:hypothetical protein
MLRCGAPSAKFIRGLLRREGLSKDFVILERQGLRSVFGNYIFRIKFSKCIPGEFIERFDKILQVECVKEDIRRSAIKALSKYLGKKL